MSATCGLVEIKNTGMEDCIGSNTVLALFVDNSSFLGGSISMIMQDAAGNVVGEYLKPGQEPSPGERFVYLADHFVLYPDRKIVGEPFMTMESVPFHGTDGWFSDEFDPILWWPCMTSVGMITGCFGTDPRGSVALLAFNSRGMRGEFSDIGIPSAGQAGDVSADHDADRDL
ncbi:MAG: hypothetical protein IJ856_01900 [Candidatus Methanomethylophilaceae archaeon]|nr:hypothetical protein [Candidatus Methanomethylophilaceae archaeon]